jgi:hypothetical protein
MVLYSNRGMVYDVQGMRMLPSYTSLSVSLGCAHRRSDDSVLPATFLLLLSPLFFDVLFGGLRTIVRWAGICIGVSVRVSTGVVYGLFGVHLRSALSHSDNLNVVGGRLG